MTQTPNAEQQSIQTILKQAERVALEVAKAEVIVDHAIEAAAMAMAAKGATEPSELTEYAKQLLHIARDAATKALQVAKKEAQVTLALASDLAQEQLAEEKNTTARSAPTEQSQSL